MGSYKQQTHYNDWPNSIGFRGERGERDGEKAEEELQVIGNIPPYACGTLLRTGPASNELKSSNGTLLEAHHWFDGYSQIYKFQIHPPSQPDTPIRVTFHARSTTAYGETADSTSLQTDPSFGQRRDPCEGFFEKVSSSFQLYWSLAPEKPVSPNIGVVLLEGVPGMPSTAKTPSFDSKAPQTLVTATTDSNGLQVINATDLKTQAVFSQTKLHRSLQGPVTASHYSKDPVTGDLYNYNLIFNPLPLYRVFRVSAATGRTEILATIYDAPAAYVHSMLITANYAVLCVWSSRYAWRGLKFLWSQNVIDSMEPFSAQQECIWYVIDRSENRAGVVATYTSDAFFSFHGVNAYEEVVETEDGTKQTSIIADLATYEDLSVLKKYYYDNLRSDVASASSSEYMAESNRARMSRFFLPNIPNHSRGYFGRVARGRAQRLWTTSTAQGVETPSIHPRLYGRRHRFIYGITNQGLSTFFDGIGKFDSETQDMQVWSQHGHTPGEPIFVPDPNADSLDENAGVLLTVVLDGYQGTSYLLVLDAKTMKEVGRAVAKKSIAFGFHGLHLPA